VGSPQAGPPEHLARVVGDTGRLYEGIGGGYARHRRSEPQIVAQLEAALGDAETVVNVGAGTGSYEPIGRHVVAVEPSVVMLAQRGASAAPAVRAIAEELPFPDQAFDAGLAVLTLHHWTDLGAGLAELQRVSRRQVLLHFVPGFGFWLPTEYFPELWEAEAETAPGVPDVVAALGEATVEVVPVPADCADGFFAAYWRRPDAYLDPTVRAGISYFARADADELEPGLQRLRDDLASGAWEARHGELLARDELDAGYRLIVSR
jgi:SAM-dependent methyltransferase